MIQVRRALLVLSCLVIFSCKPPKPVDTRQGFVIGSDDIIPATKDSGEVQADEKILRASVLVATVLTSGKTKFCSGTLISGDAPDKPLRVLTNHHCFGEQQQTGLAGEPLMLEACSNTQIYAGFFRKEGADVTQANCAEGTLRSSFDLDVAVFTLVKALPEIYQPLEISTDKDPPQKRPAVVVHYPDLSSNHGSPPKSRALLPAAAVTSANCEVIGPFAVKEWGVDRAVPYGLRHTCDIIHGSSGSALVDAESKKILGVNWGGIELKYEDGSTRIDNVATAAPFVLNFLGKNEEAIAAHIEEGEQKQEEQEDKAKQKTNIKRLLSGGKCGTIAGPAVAVSGLSWIYILGTVVFLPLLVAVGPRKH